uniref:Uncharacterized protein n=1 Tax=Ciona intestinalis TaxID=7719 RepID=H2XT90_CIOIN
MCAEIVKLHVFIFFSMAYDSIKIICFTHRLYTSTLNLKQAMAENIKCTQLIVHKFKTFLNFLFVAKTIWTGYSKNNLDATMEKQHQRIKNLKNLWHFLPATKWVCTSYDT